MDCNNLTYEKPSLKPVDILASLPKIDLPKTSLLPSTQDLKADLTDLKETVEQQLGTLKPTETAKKMGGNWLWLLVIGGALFVSVNYSEPKPVKATL